MSTSMTALRITYGGNMDEQPKKRGVRRGSIHRRVRTEKGVLSGQEVIDGKKFCTCCRTFKPVGEFYPHPRMSSGLTSWCRMCTTANERRKREERRPPEVEDDLLPDRPPEPITAWPVYQTARDLMRFWPAPKRREE